MAGERLAGLQAEEYLGAALLLARPSAAAPSRYEYTAACVAAAYAEAPELAVPTLAFDLAVLLQGERLAPVATPPDAALRDALRAWEDHVLARLLADRRWPRLCEAVAALAPGLRPAAVGHLAATVGRRLGGLAGAGVAMGALRRLPARPVAEVLEAGRAGCYAPAVARSLAGGLESLARGARRAREVLSDADVHVVENFAGLKTLAARVALEQLSSVAQAIGEGLPRRLRSHAAEPGEAPTALEQESAYPVGGFASLSTRGSLENLVSSELIYLEPGGAAGRPDLFDVRFVEGELLYYARDESVAVRRRRALVLVLDASLVRARVLDPGGSYQRLVWLLGAVTAFVRKLVEHLDAEALTFELAFAGPADEPGLDEEQGVLSLLLRQFRERGQLEFSRAPAIDAAVSAARQRHGRRAMVLAFSAGVPPAAEDAEPDARVDVVAARPVLAWRRPGLPLLAPGDDPAVTWVAVVRALIDGVLAG